MRYPLPNLCKKGGETRLPLPFVSRVDFISKFQWHALGDAVRDVVILGCCGERERQKMSRSKWQDNILIPTDAEGFLLICNKSTKINTDAARTSCNQTVILGLVQVEKRQARPRILYKKQIDGRIGQKKMTPEMENLSILFQ